MFAAHGVWYLVGLSKLG